MRRFSTIDGKRFSVGHGHNLLMMFENNTRLAIDLSAITPNAKKRMATLRIGDPDPYPPITTIILDVRTGEVSIPSYQDV